MPNTASDFIGKKDCIDIEWYCPPDKCQYLMQLFAKTEENQSGTYIAGAFHVDVYKENVDVTGRKYWHFCSLSSEDKTYMLMMYIWYCFSNETPNKEEKG